MKISDFSEFDDLMEIQFDEGSHIVLQCCQENANFLEQVLDEDEELIFDALTDEKDYF
jgi:hypothetical protein